MWANAGSSTVGVRLADAKLKACVARASSNMHIMVCNSVAQAFADARLNSVYQAWSEALKHAKRF